MDNVKRTLKVLRSIESEFRVGSQFLGGDMSDLPKDTNRGFYIYDGPTYSDAFEPVELGSALNSDLLEQAIVIALGNLLSSLGGAVTTQNADLIIELDDVIDGGIDQNIDEVMEIVVELNGNEGFSLFLTGKSFADIGTKLFIGEYALTAVTAAAGALSATMTAALTAGYSFVVSVSVPTLAFSVGMLGGAIIMDVFGEQFVRAFYDQDLTDIEYHGAVSDLDSSENAIGGVVIPEGYDSTRLIDPIRFYIENTDSDFTNGRFKVQYENDIVDAIWSKSFTAYSSKALDLIGRTQGIDKDFIYADRPFAYYADEKENVGNPDGWGGYIVIEDGESFVINTRVKAMGTTRNVSISGMYDVTNLDSQLIVGGEDERSSDYRLIIGGDGA